MRYSKEKILEALNVIYYTCNDCEDCPECPFYLDGECIIQRNSPDIWPIKQEVTDEVWRAFE